MMDPATMGAIVLLLPSVERVVMPCRRCGGLRKVTYDQLPETHRRHAPFGAVHPCPDCGEDSEVIPFEEARARRQLIVGERPEGER